MNEIETKRGKFANAAAHEIFRFTANYDTINRRRDRISRRADNSLIRAFCELCTLSSREVMGSISRLRPSLPSGTQPWPDSPLSSSSPPRFSSRRRRLSRGFRGRCRRRLERMRVSAIHRLLLLLLATHFQANSVDFLYSFFSVCLADCCCALAGLRIIQRNSDQLSSVT